MLSCKKFVARSLLLKFLSLVLAASALARRVLRGGLRGGGLSRGLLGRRGAGVEEVVEVVLFAPPEPVRQRKT